MQFSIALLFEKHSRETVSAWFILVPNETAALALWLPQNWMRPISALFSSILNKQIGTAEAALRNNDGKGEVPPRSKALIAINHKVKFSKNSTLVAWYLSSHWWDTVKSSLPGRERAPTWHHAEVTASDQRCAGPWLRAKLYDKFVLKTEQSCTMSLVH